jgi:small subunit ribosomal protein S13
MRILGITIPEEKNLSIGLTVVYGIGRSMAEKILKEANIEPTKKPKDLSVDDENKIRELVEKQKTEGDLKREVAANIRRLKDIKTYRGMRHARSLPARGQRTPNQARK